MPLRDPAGERPAQPWTGGLRRAAGLPKVPSEPPAGGPQLLSLPSPNHFHGPQRTPGQKRPDKTRKAVAV